MFESAEVGLVRRQWSGNHPPPPTNWCFPTFLSNPGGGGVREPKKSCRLLPPPICLFSKSFSKGRSLGGLRGSGRKKFVRCGCLSAWQLSTSSGPRGALKAPHPRDQRWPGAGKWACAPDQKQGVNRPPFSRINFSKYIATLLGGSLAFEIHWNRRRCEPIQIELTVNKDLK